jgi:hypothetical protein
MSNFLEKVIFLTLELLVEELNIVETAFFSFLSLNAVLLVNLYAVIA